jgi:hypothetical protein
MIKNFNYKTLAIFSPILILVGILGFILPDGITSNATAYNIFHIIFGFIGLSFVLAKKLELIRIFNVGFGLIDLYQALASYLNWFPVNQFQWKFADDVLHIIIGGGLVLIGLLFADKSSS